MYSLGGPLFCLYMSLQQRFWYDIPLDGKLVAREGPPRPVLADTTLWRLLLGFGVCLHLMLSVSHRFEHLKSRREIQFQLSEVTASLFFSNETNFLL
jgi:hypothetical protein